MPLTRAASDRLIQAAHDRVVHDRAHLEQLALVCDLFSRIDVAETRDLVASVAAYALQGSSGAATH
jgi:hypothetical protein